MLIETCSSSCYVLGKRWINHEVKLPWSDLGLSPFSCDSYFTSASLSRERKTLPVLSFDFPPPKFFPFTVLLFFSQGLIYSDSDTANMSCQTGQGRTEKGRERDNRFKFFPSESMPNFGGFPKNFHFCSPPEWENSPSKNCQNCWVSKGERGDCTLLRQLSHMGAVVAQQELNNVISLLSRWHFVFKSRKD